jgi:hypothetical protein
VTVPEEEGEVVGHGVRGAHQRGGHCRLQHSTQKANTKIFMNILKITKLVAKFFVKKFHTGDESNIAF